MQMVCRPLPRPAAHNHGVRIIPAERHRLFILPVLGPTSRFIIAGMRCTADGFLCISVRCKPVLG